jgi:light-regulated signal transduction histidine kinase (bacteriophytochrome)
VGREEIKLEMVDCKQIVQEVLAEFEGVISRHKARITCGELPTLKTSPTVMRVLLQNLIGNALKFQDGKRIPEVAIEAQQRTGNWCLSVRDNGIGIDPAFHKKLFVIFQRLNRREDYPGTGIGLSTCRKLVRLCGGDIEFESAPGQGSLFYFTLPITEKPTEEKLAS